MTFTLVVRYYANFLLDHKRVIVMTEIPRFQRFANLSLIEIKKNICEYTLNAQLSTLNRTKENTYIIKYSKKKTHLIKIKSQHEFTS